MSGYRTLYEKLDQVRVSCESLAAEKDRWKTEAEQVTERLFALQDAVSGSRDERALVKRIEALKSENADLQAGHHAQRERIIALEEQRDRQAGELIRTYTALADASARCTELEKKFHNPVVITPTSFPPLVSLSVGQRQEIEQMIKKHMTPPTFRDVRVDPLTKRVDKLERRYQKRALRPGRGF